MTERSNAERMDSFVQTGDPYTEDERAANRAAIAAWIRSLGATPPFGGMQGGPPPAAEPPSPMMAGPGVPPPVPSPFEPQVTDSQMPGPPLADATAPTLNDQDPAAMAQLAEQMGGEFLPPQATDSQMQPPPVAPPMPPQIASPFTPEPSPPLGAVPDFSGPAPQRDLGAIASMQAGPFASGAQEPQLPPQIAQRSPFDDSRSIESYFSDQSLAKRLQDAQRYARSDALLGAGAAMLGANDLQSGLGAAGEAIRGPRAELQRKREELPGQYELARFGMEGERERRGYAATKEEREEEEAARDRTRFGFEVPGLERKAAAEEHALDRLPFQDELDQADLEAKRTGNLENQARVDKIRQDMEQAAKLLPTLIRKSEAEATRDEAYSEYMRSGGAGRAGSTAGQITPDDVLRVNGMVENDIAQARTRESTKFPDAQRLVYMSRYAQNLDEASQANFPLAAETAEIIERLLNGETQEEILRRFPGMANEPALMRVFEYIKEQTGAAAAEGQ